MIAVLEAAKNVTQIFGLLAFVFSLLFFAFTKYLQYKERVAQDIANPDDKLAYLKDWLKLNTDKITEQRTFELAEQTIQLKYRKFRTGCILSVMVLIICMFTLLTLTYLAPKTNGVACLDSLRRAESELSRSDYSASLDLFTNAVATCGAGDWRPANGQGVAYLAMARYPEASQKFGQALTLAKASRSSSADQGMLLVNTGYALEGQRDYLGAFNAYKAATPGFDPASNFYKDNLFSAGRMLQVLWIDKEYPADTDNRKGALAEFEHFLSAGGTPRRWAYYNIACLRATDLSSQEGNDALGELLMQTARELADDSSEKGALQQIMFKRLIADPKSVIRKPTEPIVCPGFARLFEVCDKCKAQVMAIVSAKFR